MGWLPLGQKARNQPMRRPLSRNRRAEVKTRPGRRLGVGTMTGRASPTLRAGMLGLDTGYIYRVAIRVDCRRHVARWVGWLQQAYLKPKVAKIYPLRARKWPDWTDDFVAAT